MKINVLLFAAAREAAGQNSVQFDAPQGATIRTVRELLIHQQPKLNAIGPSLLWAVNNQYAADDRVLRDNDTVACFPPVSGG